MDEEELEQPSPKINVGSFFERVDAVDRVANRALSRANANLGIINNQQLVINSLSVSIEAMETKIRDIANYIIIEKKIEKDAEEDRRLEKEDREQKNKMLERAMGLKGDPGPQGEQGVKGEDRDPGGGGFLGGLIKTIAAIGIGGFALKYIGPVLLPKLLLLAKTKLIPIIGTALKGAFTKLASLLGATLKGLVAKIPVVGKALAGGGLIGGISAGIAKIGSFISNALSGKGGGQTSDSNLKVDSSPVNEMTDTLTEKNLVESNNEEMKEFELEANELRRQRDIAEETGKTDISDVLKQNISEDDVSDIEIGEVNSMENRKKRARRQIEIFTKKLNNTSNDKLKNTYRRKIDEAERFLGVGKFDPNVTGIKPNAKIEVDDEGNLLNPEDVLPNKFEKLEPVSDNKGVDLSLKGLDERVNNVANVVTDQGNKDQNQGVVTPLNTSQTAEAAVKIAKSDISFVRLTKNQYISVSPTSKGLPTEVLRRLS